jgi:hypothetical protein
VGNEAGDTREAKAWFEEIGARGLASLGAVSGLILSLMIVLATAPPLPARPSERKSEQSIPIEKPDKVEAKPVSATRQGLIAAPQPLASAPNVEAAVSVPSPTNALSTSSMRPLVSAPQPGRPAPEATASPSIYAESGSSDFSYLGRGGGTVHVSGYYRKNGTYVQPHTRRSRSR